MSKSLYSVFEYVDQKTGKWETANLYSKHRDGNFDIAQLILGNSEYVSALFGREPFDVAIDADGEIIDNLVDPIERIEEIIADATSGLIPSNASADAKEYYEQFGMAGWGGDSDKKQYPDCVTYTLRDIEMIEVLSKGASASALRTYNRFFAPIRWLLYAIKGLEYTSSGASVRVIAWGS